MDTSTTTEEFQTDSINLAAFLVALGFKIESFNWDNGPGCWMKFRQVEGLTHHVFQYLAGVAEVNANKYATSLANTKRELHQSRPASGR